MAHNERGQFIRGTHWRPEKPYWKKSWLEEHYTEKQMSASEIAQMFGITENAIYFWLKKHQIPGRTMSEVRKAKRWGSFGPDNPMWNRKGEMSPNWRGGVTKERQLFYASQEWKTACRVVWKRDRGCCQRCGGNKTLTPDMPMHIHHVVPFANVPLRADASNLVLLCEACHRFVHSRKNVNHEHLS